MAEADLSQCMANSGSGTGGRMECKDIDSEVSETEMMFERMTGMQNHNGGKKIDKARPTRALVGIQGSVKGGGPRWRWRFGDGPSVITTTGRRRMTAKVRAATAYSHY